MAWDGSIGRALNPPTLVLDETPEEQERFSKAVEMDWAYYLLHASAAAGYHAQEPVDTIRWCSACKRHLLRTEFQADSKGLGGLKRWCRSCCGQAIQAWRRSKGVKERRVRPEPRDGEMFCMKCNEWRPEARFTTERARPGGRAIWCNGCKREAMNRQAARKRAA